MASTFLEPDEIAILTGRPQRSRQIQALAKMGVPFFVNDIGRPVVARSAVEGRGLKTEPAPKKAWVPKALTR